MPIPSGEEGAPSEEEGNGAVGSSADRDDGLGRRGVGKWASSSAGAGEAGEAGPGAFKSSNIRSTAASRSWREDGEVDEGISATDSPSNAENLKLIWRSRLDWTRESQIFWVNWLLEKIVDNVSLKTRWYWGETLPVSRLRTKATL